MILSDISLNTEKCKNCGSGNIGEFCPDCGQKTYKSRFTTRAYFKAFLNAFNLEKGFFYTLITLFKNPGRLISEYLNGKTKSYFNPLKYIIFIAGVNAALAVWFHVVEAQQESALGFAGDEFITSVKSSKLTVFIKNYLNVLEIIILPVFGLVSKWVYKIKKLFYGEHLIIMSYLFAQTSVIAICFYPMYLIFPVLYNYSAILTHGLTIIYMTYALNSVFKRNIVKSFLGAITINYLGIILFFLIFYILFFVVFMFLKLSGVPVKELMGL